MKYTFISPEIDDAMVLPVAIELGYKEEIETTESFSNQTEVPEGAINIQNFTQIDGSILYSYDIVSKSENPETIDEFIQQYFRTHFLREKILPAMVKVQTAALEAEKKAKEEELEKAKKQVEESLISIS